MYQTDIDASVDWSINTLPTQFSTKDVHGWTRIPDAAGKYVGECLSYIKREFTHRTGEPAPSAGGWAEGYLKLPGSLGKYFAVERFDPNKEYPKGSWIFNTPTHHVAQYLAKSGSSVLIAEQNADPDGSGLHITTRAGNRFDMIMVPHVDQPVPPPAPVPILVSEPTPPPIVVHPYTIQIIDPKQVQLIRDAKKYGLNYDNWAAMDAHPEGQAPKDTIITVQAIAYHQEPNGPNTFYLEDGNVPSGWATGDCTDYTPPPPPKTTPNAPLPFPNDTEPYGVIKKIRAYTSSNNAINRINWGGTYVNKGTYMVFNRKTGAQGLLAVNVTSKQGQAGAWINVADNVADTPEQVAAKIAESRTPPILTASDPAPEPIVIAPPVEKPLETEAVIRNSFMYLQQSGRPVEFEVVNNVLLTDRIHGGKALNVKAGTVVKIHGTFEQGGRSWALVKLARDTDNYAMYGFPINSRSDFRPSLDDIFDFSTQIKYGFELFIDNLHKTIDGIFKVTKK